MRQSWVYYSVAVYLGLLLAGSLIPSRQAAAWPTGADLLPPRQPAIETHRPASPPKINRLVQQPEPAPANHRH